MAVLYAAVPGYFNELMKAGIGMAATRAELVIREQRAETGSRTISIRPHSATGIKLATPM